jgi:hypothetical protein
MASWGFVVIAAQDKNSGSGQTILDGANFLIAANSNPANIFFHKLNTSQIGAFGHSQGATGAINALKKSAGTIKTVMPIELPEQLFCSSPQNCADTSTLTQGSIFLIDGSSDILISPPTQPASATGLQSIAAYYSAVPAGIIKVKGTLIGPTHSDVQGSPNCTAATLSLLAGCLRVSRLPDGMDDVSTAERQLCPRRVRKRHRRALFRNKELATGGQHRPLIGRRRRAAMRTSHD